MRRVLAGVVFAVVTALVVPSGARAQSADLGERYLSSLLAIWGEDASPGDVDRLGLLLSEDAVYEHPGVGARIEGHGRIVEAMAGFIGQTRDPSVRNVEITTGSGVVVLAFDLELGTRRADRWSREQRRQVVVLETDADTDRVSRILDYWQ